MAENNNKHIKTYVTKDYVNDVINENRLCYENITIESGTIIFDGTIKDTDEVIDLGGNAYAVKVLDVPLQKEDLIGRTATLQSIEEGELTVTISGSHITNGSTMGFPNTSILFGLAIIVFEDNLNFYDIILNKGTYFLIEKTEPSTYISHLEYETKVSDLKQLDEKFIPDTIARVENLPYCDTRITEPAIITYDGDYPDKQIVVLYEGEWQIECFVRIHDSLSFAEESDIVAIALGGSYDSERLDNLAISKCNEETTSIIDANDGVTWLLNIKSDTVLDASYISWHTDMGELSLSEGLWAFHLAVKQDLENVSLEENNEVNPKGLANFYVREVEYNKAVKGNAKRVDGQDFLTTKKYVDNAIIKDYNDLKNRPCYDSYATVEYIYDGNFVGKTIASHDRIVKVSDDVVTYEEFKNATLTFKEYYVTVTYNMSSMEEGIDYYLSDDGLSLCSEFIYIAYEDNVICDGVTLPQKGIYFYDSEAMVNSSSNVNAKVITIGHVGSLSIKRKEFKQLDEKFIPNTIATKQYVDDSIAQASIGGGDVDTTGFALKADIPTKTSQLTNDSGFLTAHQDISGKADKTELHNHNNKTVLDNITNDMMTKWNKALPFEDSYVADCNTWLTNGYTKVSSSATVNHPSQCTGADKWGILFFVAENAAQGTGTQMYFPIDGTYKGRVFVRSITNRSPGAWTLLSTFDGDYNSLTNKPAIPSINGLATETYVNNAVSDLVDSAPETLNTLNELAQALGDDPNFATTIANQIGQKADASVLNNYALKTEIPTDYITESELNAKGYLTEHQDISGKADKSELFSKDYNDLTNKPIRYLTDAYGTASSWKVDVNSMEAGFDYKFPPDATKAVAISYRFINSEQKTETKNLVVFTQNSGKIPVIHMSEKVVDSKYVIMVGHELKVQLDVVDNGDGTKSVTATGTPLTLSTSNEKEYTPTSDYNPATKKYVDGAVSGLSDNLQGQIDELFQNVSNGKELIASAITDKGVDASEEETFQSLSEKIGLIPSGPPGSNIIGYINEENDIYVSLTELESGTYTLKFEDYSGLLDDFEDIGNVEVE